MKKIGKNNSLIYILISIIVGITINIIFAQIVLAFKLPLYLDSIGTVFVAATCGYVPGIFVGFLSNVINSIGDPITLYYGIISTLIAILATFFSQIGIFKRWWKVLLSVLAFAVIGGVLGSLLTWGLFGLSFGEGMSAPYALFIYNHFNINEFSSQLCADFTLDILDKMITIAVFAVTVRFLPNKLLILLPMGKIYYKKNNQYFEKDYKPFFFDKKRSLKTKVAMLIIITSVTLGGLTTGIGSSLYKNEMNEHHYESANNVINIATKAIDADKIVEYLNNYKIVYDENNEEIKEYIETPDYLATREKLSKIKDSFSNEVKYLYVYYINEEGCHVVYDVDTADLPGEKLGTVLEFDETFTEYLPILFQGGEIEPIQGYGQYGWLYTMYKPLFNSDGEYVAYIAVDIDMQEVTGDRYTFLIQMISLSFGISIIIVAFTLVYAQRKIIDPINKLTYATQEYAYDEMHKNEANFKTLENLNINTGDEIEKLYKSITKTTKELDQYIDEIDKQSKYISRLQDNVIISFAEMVENRDDNTGQHIKRTSLYVKIIGEELMKEKQYPNILDKEFLNRMVKSAPLHDIGKIKIPDAILNKPGRLTSEEFEIIKTHTSEGKKILKTAIGGLEGENYLHVAMNMAGYHHERYDGKGYPEGLAGEDIPICAKIMAIADVFDALTSKRSYKDAFTIEESVKIMLDEKGKQFDPVIIDAFVRCLKQIEKVQKGVL